MADPTPEQKKQVPGTQIDTPSLFLRVLLPDGSALTVGQRKGPYLQIFRSIRQWCPYLFFEIDDVAGCLQRPESRLNDGSPLFITIGIGAVTETSLWVCYGTPKRQPSNVNPQIFTYTVKALPMGVTDTMVQKPDRSWTGTATEVLEAVTDQLRMDFVTNLQTTDSMTWLSTNKVWKEYITDIARHTYAGDHAVIMDGIDSTTSANRCGTYYLMNVPDLFKGNPKLYIHHGASFSGKFAALSKITSLSCAKAQHDSRSGYHGFRSLYGMDTQEIRPDGTVAYHSKVTPQDASRSPDVSRLSHEVGTSSPKVVHRPLPCGNVHDNYIKAEHIFDKSRGIYGQLVTVLVGVPTTLKLFDLVIFTQAMADGSMMEEVSGYYIVSGKTVFVVSNQYYEKIELMAGGLN